MLLEYLVSWHDLIGCYHGGTIFRRHKFPKMEIMPLIPSKKKDKKDKNLVYDGF